MIRLILDSALNQKSSLIFTMQLLILVLAILVKVGQ